MNKEAREAVEALYVDAIAWDDLAGGSGRALGNQRDIILRALDRLEALEEDLRAQSRGNQQISLGAISRALGWSNRD